MLAIESTYPWADCIKCIQDVEETAPPEPVDAAELTKSLQMARDIQADQKKIQALIDSIKRSSVAHNNRGPYGTINKQVSDKLSALIKVRPKL